MTLIKRYWDRRLVDRRQVCFYILIHILAISTLIIYPSFQGLILVLIGHFLTGCFGISLGFHRLLSHKSFKTSSAIKYLFSLFGTLSLQGGPLSWVGVHRAHHRYDDGRGDPHSMRKGRFFTHIGWAVHKGPNGFRFKNLQRYAADIAQDPILMFME